MSGLLRFILDDDLSCSCLLRSCGSGLGVAGRESPGGELLFFASPKKSNQKKGDPQSGSLRLALGNLRCSKAAEFLETCLLRSFRTSKNFNPLTPALVSTARTGGGIETAFGLHSRKPLERRRGAQGKADQGACLFEALAEFARDPALTPYRSESAAKRKDDEQGRLFFCLLCFWRSTRKLSCCRATPGLRPQRKPTAYGKVSCSQ